MKQNEIPRNPFKFVGFVTGLHKWWAAGAISAVFAATVLSRIETLVIKNITDIAALYVSGKTSDFNALLFWGFAYPVIYFLSQCSWRISGFTGMQWITRAEATVHTRLFKYLTRHSRSYFNSRFAGALTNKVSNAARGTAHLLATLLWEFLPLFIGFLTYCFILMSVHWLLALVLSSWVIVFIGLNAFLVYKTQPFSFAYAKSSSTLKGKMVDVASNISVVQEAAHHEFEDDYVGRYIHGVQRAHLTHWWYSEWILLLNSVLVSFFSASLIGSSLYLLKSGAITVGVIIMVIFIIIDLARQLFFIGREMVRTTEYYGEINEGLAELLKTHDIVDDPQASRLNAQKAQILFDAITFEYNKNEVFSDFTLAIKSGQKVGVIGKSGVGKTTLINLLLRHYDIQEGKITINDQDIRKVTLESLRKNIAFVPQDVTLFHRSIRENIQYGSLDAKDTDIVEAAKKAQAHDFITALPDSYDTLVGERGVKLSGGQKQRIAIARAILKDVPILILDEATSSLDSESEEAIQKALGTLMKGRTVIAIAHRLSTLKRMDRIIVLEEGKIVEDGSHAELVKAGKVYQRLWESQVKGFIADEAL